MDTTLEQYKEFLQSKVIIAAESGFTVEPSAVHPILFPFQRDIVVWACRLGKAAVFADCGTGKTLMLLEWARLVNAHTGKPVLIASPLGVTGQTIKEGLTKLDGLEVVYARRQSDLSGTEQLVITNYEMLHGFRPSYFGGLVADESSILKNFTGKTKRQLISMAQAIPFRLACTATPAPNDNLELGNHADFLGIMRSREMIQRWFVNDTMHAGGYRLREHGQEDFWRWVSSWAVSLQKPSDIGDYSDDGYVLPDLNFIGHVVGVDHTRAWLESDSNGQMSLLLAGNTSATSMHREKRATVEQRMETAAQVARDTLSKNPNEYVIVWCEYNYEADMLRKLLPDAIEIRGSEPLEVKQDKLLAFSNGDYHTLITKPKIAAHGLNWQHAGVQVWTSINHKFEQFYQGYKRSHRFGRVGAVDCHIVYAESEGAILSNLRRKHAEHKLKQREMVRAMRENGMSVRADHRLNLMGDWGEYRRGDGWKLYHGDSAQTLQAVASDSVGFIVQSPPFKGLYIYSGNAEDLGNCATSNEFYQQYQFILQQEYRILKPGGYKSEHCKDLPLYQNRDGAMGLQDFPGELIQAHRDAGFEFVDWVTIWKDPVIEMQRTKNAGLLWSSAFCERAERARQGMADYVLIFRKLEQESGVVEHSHKPLPLAVVERCIDLWTNPGENVQTPYHRRLSDAQPIDLMIVNDVNWVMPHIEGVKHWLRPGRNLVVNIDNPLDMAGLIASLHPHGLVFHSRVAMTNGNWLLVFRKWVSEMDEDKNPDIIHVKHELVAPFFLHEVVVRRYVDKDWSETEDGEWLTDESGIYELVTKHRKDNKNPNGHTFIGTDGPKFWDSDRDYSIQTWQRYASPVWYDLDGLPPKHPLIWFDINQTNVLNHRIAREDGDERHICPLQLDLIEKCILRYSQPDDLVHTSFAGVGSEMVTALKLGRRAVGSELKRSYYEMALRHIRDAEKQLKMPTLLEK